MPSPTPPSLTASPKIKTMLVSLARSRTKPAAIVQRANMILKMLEGANNTQVARQFEVNVDKTRRWRSRWLAITPRLQELEAELLEDDQASLANALEVLLADNPRPGVAPTFSPEQIVQIIALACENPLDSGFSFEYWTACELARQAKARGIVAQISPASIIRFLKRGLAQTASLPLLAQSQRKGPPRV